MRPIAPEQFIVNLMSLCIFPFAARPMIMAMLGMDDRAASSQFITRRRAGPAGVLPGSAASMKRRLHRLPGRCCWRRRRRRRSAQTAAPPAREPLQLAALQRDARDADPRARELDLLAQQTELRLRNIEAERCRRSARTGRRSISPTCPTSPFIAPDGQPLFSRAEGHLRRLTSASISACSIATIQPRSRLSARRLAEAQARVRTALFGLRQEVNDAFFAAALLQEQLGALAGHDRRSRRRGCARRRRASAKERRCRPTPPRSKRRSCSSASRTRRAPRRTAARRWRGSRRSPAARSTPTRCSALPELAAARRRRRATR